MSVDDAGSGQLRARTLPAEALADPGSYDRRSCRVMDCSGVDGFRPELREHGFARADLSRLRGVQAALARVRDAGRVDEADAAEIRRGLTGRRLPLSGGARLWVLHVAREGFFMRRGGPNGMPMGSDTLGMNGHDAAVMVHADQDVDGTPLRQLLRGAAPWLFHHDSPDRSNLRSRLFLVNLWIGLEQVTRPLALMDKRSLDRRAHQLRHGLVTDSFLRRREDMRINDIWTFLHDAGQRWYFSSEMDITTGYVFETLGTPHGSLVLAGEERAEARYRQLVAAAEAVERGDCAGAVRVLAAADDVDSAWPEPATAPLRQAIAVMEGLLAEARASSSALCRGEGAAGWLTRARAAAERVVRRSLEMRVVGLVL